MKKTAALCACIIFMLSLVGCGSSTESGINEEAESTAETISVPEGDTSETGNILVVYFSATGNTKAIAEYVADVTDGDLVEIVPEQAYSDADLNYNDDSCRANAEQADESLRPAIKNTIDNFSEYDVVFIGHPIWWGKEPRIIDTFMENYDFSEKTVVNFCTSGGSGIETASANLKKMAENANWLDGKRFNTGASREEVQAWVETLNIL